MITCVLCMENFVQRDLVKIYGCGHQFHFQCYLRNLDKMKCPVCRQVVLSKADILWGESISLFSDKTSCGFETLVINNLVFKREIFEKKLNELVLKSEEDKKRYQEIINKFVDENICQMRVKILEQLNENKYIVNVYSCPYGQLIEGEPFIFLASGPRGKPTYFIENNMKSIVDLIQERVGYLFLVKLETYRNTNNIVVYLSSPTNAE